MATKSTIAIKVISAPLPEGWEGTPDEFRQKIFSTLTFEGSGAFITGQVGGAMPTTDVGVYIDGDKIYVWSEEAGHYVPIHTEEIGVIKPYLGSVAPDNYLLLDGASYKRSDYTELYGLIGDNYKIPGTADDRFCVPNMCGRTVFGIGTGKYNPKEDPLLPSGLMREILLHQYDGLEWPRRVNAKHVGQPPASTSPGDCMVYTGVVGNQYTRSMPPHLGINWMVRAK